MDYEKVIINIIRALKNYPIHTLLLITFLIFYISLLVIIIIILSGNYYHKSSDWVSENFSNYEINRA